MKTIQNYLVKQQSQFTQHRFFQQLTDDITLEQFASMASCLSFWVMSFQDLLRLNEARITNVEIRDLVRRHRLENTGHEHWFVSDVNEMKCKVLTLQSIYSRNYVTTRDATYAIMSEVFQARNDYERIALLLALESTSNIFLGVTVDFVDTLSYSISLRYFSDYNLEFEKNYAIFEQKLTTYLADIHLTQDDEENLLKMIERVYHAFNLMFDGLTSALTVKPKVEKIPTLALL
ncbi:hypothetical protein [Anabaena subtropica]|uniref:Uncharacterized protein n=1 Tax=Anabaena subtropica FACHB-260 TaxID=2692884 RepID=A0ABR8CN51_9NOST|nr:hypothetical protein [Anabaena subtropica]MBD2344647.1 hypothetical protein [Anabaena subtropica FACHB-260]